jgi:hypothetical protein
MIIKLSGLNHGSLIIEEVESYPLNLIIRPLARLLTHGLRCLNEEISGLEGFRRTTWGEALD